MQKVNFTIVCRRRRQKWQNILKIAIVYRLRTILVSKCTIIIIFSYVENKKKKLQKRQMPKLKAALI